MRRAAAALAAALLATGCGGSAATVGTSPQTEPAPAGTGWFVGSGGQGLGASLDLLADDETVRAVDDALAATASASGAAPAVGIAAVVNNGPVAVPIPRFAALFEGGGALPLVDARDALAGLRGPDVRRARALLGPAPRFVPAEGAVTLYVVLRGADPAEVASARMVSGAGEPVAMAARGR